MKVHHIGIMVNNLEASHSFYREHFGFKVKQLLQFLEEDILFIQREEVVLELIKGSMAKNTHHFCLEVDCVEKWMKRLNNHNLQPIEGPYDLNNGWKVVFYEGPDDEIIELLEVGTGKTTL
ncbi:VOC family protein [Bacillus spongiae]|uniref:VOC family protein n=1 Tax=Bacillus spongiae TaxID=2683610 RepID=A0ABU8HHT7_9BACI